jgi:hypothetical protein
MHLLKISTFCVTIVLIFVPMVYSLGHAFSPSIQVDEGLVSSQYAPKILCGDDGTLYVTWVDTRDGDYNIYFSRSEDRGRTWLTPNVRVSDVPTGLEDYPPSMAIDESGTLYTTWTRYQRAKHIYFAKSSDRGNTWTSSVQVDDNSNGVKKLPVVCVDVSGDIYVVWEDHRPYDDTDIYFARSTDGGETWTDPNIRINDDPSAYQHSPSMVIDPWGVLYVAYDGHPEGEYSHIYLVKSTDGGDTWSRPHVQVDDGRSGNHYVPELAIGRDGTIYASWSWWGGDHILFAKSIDGGESWSRPSIQVDYTPDNYFWNDFSSIAVDEAGNIYVSWDAYNHEDAEPDVFFGVSTDGGYTWTNPSVRVNDVTYYAQDFSAIASGDGQQAYIVWKDSRGGWDIAINGIYSSRTVPVLAYGEADCDTVASGGNLGVTITMINTTGYEHTADIWTGIALLKGGMYYGVDPAFGPQTFSLPPYDTLSEYVTHEIAEDFPLGEYEYWVKVDDEYPDHARRTREVPRTHLFKDSFIFTVVEGREKDTGGLIR